MSSFWLELTAVLPPDHQIPWGFCSLIPCVCSQDKRKDGGERIAFSEVHAGPLVSAAINRKWVTEQLCREQTLEKKSGFRASLHLLRAYCVSVVVI